MHQRHWVGSAVLKVHMSDRFWRRTAQNPQEMKRIVREIVKLFTRVSGSSYMSVWLYRGQEKVLEGDVSFTGELRFK